MAEARARYERGIRLYDEGAYEAARSEFERAYSLVPTYKLLYNIALVREQLADFVSALDNFQRYLKEGGDELSPERKKVVEAEIAKLLPRIGKVDVTINVPGSDVFVDDVPVGKSPLTAPLSVNPGRRKISASHKGRLPATKVVDVAGSEQVHVSLDLPQAGGTTVIVTNTSRRIPWVGWIATGALAIGSGVFGYLAIDQSSKLDDAKNAGPNPDPSSLDSRSKRIKAYSITADLLGASAIIAGGISLYFTIKWGKETPKETTSPPKPATAKAPVLTMPTMRAGITPGGLSLTGTF